LIHNLPNSIFEPEFTEHDIWFLNVQAKAYITGCDPELSPLYLEQRRRLKELFALVPDSLRGKLKWSGPE
jgi:hypothetical protein